MARPLLVVSASAMLSFIFTLALLLASGLPLLFSCGVIGVASTTFNFAGALPPPLAAAGAASIQPLA